MNKETRRLISNSYITNVVELITIQNYIRDKRMRVHDKLNKKYLKIYNSHFNFSVEKVVNKIKQWGYVSVNQNIMLINHNY